MPSWGAEFAAAQLAQEYTSQGRSFGDAAEPIIGGRGITSSANASYRSDEAKAARRLVPALQSRDFNADLFAYALMHDGVTEQAFELALAIVRETMRRFVEGQAFSEKDSDYGVMAGFMLDGLAQMNEPKSRHRRS